MGATSSLDLDWPPPTQPLGPAPGRQPIRPHERAEVPSPPGRLTNVGTRTDALAPLVDGIPVAGEHEILLGASNPVVQLDRVRSGIGTLTVSWQSGGNLLGCFWEFADHRQGWIDTSNPARVEHDRAILATINHEKLVLTLRHVSMWRRFILYRVNGLDRGTDSTLQLVTSSGFRLLLRSPGLDSPPGLAVALALGHVVNGALVLRSARNLPPIQPERLAVAHAFGRIIW